LDFNLSSSSCKANLAFFSFYLSVSGLNKKLDAVLAKNNAFAAYNIKLCSAIGAKNPSNVTINISVTPPRSPQQCKRSYIVL
jgi:hypothetical protein